LPKRLKIYEAGGMENETNMGASWRDTLSAHLSEKYNVKIYNPVEFEPEQLEGLRPSRLPSEFTARTGKTIKPKHWHDLKFAARTSTTYSRFKRYMRQIIHYDINLIETDVDYVICYWTEGASKGAGTHSELTAAFRKHIPVFTVVQKGVDFPGWLEGCSTRVFDSFEELYKFLEEEFSLYKV
jgi:hypothetical protein